MFESPGFALFVLVAVVFLGWYAVGTQFNVRLGNNVLKWLREGLRRTVGEKATLRWLGSSVVEVKIDKAKDPFRSAEVLVVMEPRDILFFWWWGRMRGRRDLLIFRAQLSRAPGFDLEVHLPRAWAAPNLKNQSPHWTAVQGGLSNGMEADYRGQLSPYTINHLVVTAGMDGLTLSRLAVRRAVPNLEVHYLLPRFDQVPAQRVLDSLRLLTDEILQV